MKRISATAAWIAAIGSLLVFSLAGDVRAQDDPAFELHDWSVWLADPTLEHVNAKDHFKSAMPGVVDSTRSRQGSRGEYQPQPLGLLTFYGDAVADIEVDLRVQDGRFMAHWPPSRAKSNRLSWIEMSLSTEPEEASQLSYVSPEHWFHQARDAESLFVRRGARTERFIAYDAELKFTVPVKLSGGPDTYHVENLGATTLKDLIICLPTPEGRRIGWLDTLPAGEPAEAAKESPTASATQPASDPPAAVFAQPGLNALVPVRAVDESIAESIAESVVESTSQDSASPKPKGTTIIRPSPAKSGPTVEVVMSPPLAADDDQLPALTRTALAGRLSAVGLKQQEIELLLSRFGEAMFESDSMTVVFRYPDAFVHERLPLVTYPEPVRTVRVALVLVRNIDPQIVADVRKLVDQLGHAKYAQRETAHKRLAELGRLAVPALKAALKNSDAEIVIRAERLLLAQNESIDSK